MKSIMYNNNVETWILLIILNIIFNYYLYFGKNAIIFVVIISLIIVKNIMYILCSFILTY